jgi:Raf kinase inhibitor-like YbhB/YbcL family protein
MKLTSKAFAPGEMIPKKYTCDGPDVSPPLAWAEVPEGTRSLALICDDPDAPVGTWVHWVYYNIPPDIDGLPENVSTQDKPVSGGTQGINDFRRKGYGGPCPPGGTHRYYFKLYALDIKLELKAGANKQTLLEAMQGHVRAETELVGKYRR